MLITLLESSNREVVFCSCGVLINLMVDNENRRILQADNGVRKYASFTSIFIFYLFLLFLASWFIF